MQKCSKAFFEKNNMNIQEKKYELIKFEDDDFSLDVNVSPEEDTLWLTQKDMALLFNVSIDNISLHIKNIINEGELDQSVFEESSITASDGKKYKTKIYNLDMIISVGYRVKSRRGIIFSKWANSILKQYLINGYAINILSFTTKMQCLICVLPRKCKYIHKNVRVQIIKSTKIEFIRL